MLLIAFIINSIHVASAVICQDYDKYAFPEPNSTCEGDLCFAVRPGGGKSPIMGCLSGVPKPSHECSLSYEDGIVCYCDTDMCNNKTIFRSNFTVLPVVECKEVTQREYVAAACNMCQRRVEFKAITGVAKQSYEFVECSRDGESFDYIYTLYVVYHEERIMKAFFPDACYNTTMHVRHFTVFCRCSQKNCNTPEADDIPFPIAPPTVSCYTGGMDAFLHSEKYLNRDGTVDDSYAEKVKFDNYSDPGDGCRGHFCFVAQVENRALDASGFYKGCISANEQGDLRIQLGYSLLNSVHWHICNSDFCNADIETVLKDASNATLVKDNGSTNLNCFSPVLIFLLTFIKTLSTA